MPDLGKYAAEVLTAYGISLALVGAIILMSIRSARKAKQRLDALSAKGERNG